MYSNVLKMKPFKII